MPVLILILRHCFWGECIPLGWGGDQLIPEKARNKCEAALGFRSTLIPGEECKFTGILIVPVLLFRCVSHRKVMMRPESLSPYNS